MKPPPTPDEPWYTIRGLSFTEDPSRKSSSGVTQLDGALSEATTIPSKWKGSNIGFRCVKDAQ
jgi:hypothetical protein